MLKAASSSAVGFWRSGLGFAGPSGAGESSAGRLASCFLGVSAAVFFGGLAFDSGGAAAISSIRLLSRIQ